MIDLKILTSQLNSSSIDQELAKRSHLKFMEYTWPFKSLKFLTGFHIIDICNKIDQAFEDLKHGKSTFLSIKVPYRHHKSQTVTRSLPPHFLGEFPEGEIIVSSYGQALSNGFSRDSRKILKSELYNEIYPNTEISKDSSSVSEWGVDTTTPDGSVKIGKTAWVSTGGSVTGRGGSLIILDDFLKGRVDAESETIRDKIWEAFTNDIMTRRADPCIVIVLATPWHTDDVFGRISKKMEEDKSFPKFGELKYPARSDKYPTGYLFPEKFSKDWYESQYATLGTYNASGLLDCDPDTRGGNLLKVEEGVNWFFVDEMPKGFNSMTRGWDLASTEKETQKDDPDWTVGVKGATKVEHVRIRDLDKDAPIPNIVSIYIDDIARIREDAPKRDRMMTNIAIKDGHACSQYVEAVAGYKDAFKIMKNILKGISRVFKSEMPGDKIVKAATHLEVPFEAGNVYINRKIAPSILKEYLKTLKGFPAILHDDDVDATAIMVAGSTSSGASGRYGGVL